MRRQKLTLHQSLKALVGLLALFYPSQATSQTNAAATEVRALWVVRTTLTSPEKIQTMVEAAANNGFNTIIVQVRGRGDAYYRSSREPRATELKDQPPNFDPLAVTLAEAKKRGLKVHAWLNTSLLANLDALPTDPKHVYNKHPEWLAVPRPVAAELNKMSPKDPRYRARIVEWSKANRGELEGIYTGPANPKVREHIYQIWMDVLKNYEVDGLHFDYVRLASPDFDYSRTSLDNFRKWLKRSGALAAGPSARLAEEPRGLVAVRKGGLPPLFQLSQHAGLPQLQTVAEDHSGMPFTQKSHPRQWVDGSSPAYNGAMTEFLNPTHGSGWMVQTPPWVWENRREKAGLEPSTHFRGWYSRRRSALAPGRLDLNYPPTAVGGISEFSHSLGSGWVSFASQAPKPTDSTQSIKQNPLALAEAYPKQFADFQREQITTLVQRIYREVKRRKPQVTVSAAVFANDENAYTRRYQDWRRWLSMGIVDIVCPMAYTTDTNIFRTQIQVATTTAHAFNKKVWAGIGAYRIPVDSTIEKINAARSVAADGIILFSYDSTTRPSPLNPTADYLDRVRRNAFDRTGPE